MVQFLAEQHRERLDEILNVLRRRVPRLERVDAEPLGDGRLLLRVKDAPFAEPVQARFVSDGTLKMLAYLIVLHDPSPAPLIGIEEPENFLHPRLLPELAEECRDASTHSQLFVTTHSPDFVNGARPEEVRVLYRQSDGFTRVQRVADMPEVSAFMAEGASLGQLWVENHFDVGDPLTNAGGAGLAKIEAARRIASFMDVENNDSRSFQVFRDGVRRLNPGSPRASK